MPNRIDLSGRKFGRLTVHSAAARSSTGKLAWACQCECGGRIVALGDNLRRGLTKSCGCLATESAKQRFTTHGLSKSNTYGIWRGMINRCHNHAAPAYEYYGALGISVCDRWHSFENFLSDMGECPPGMSIDRVNNSEGYSPQNCRWATMTVQAANRSDVARKSKASRGVTHTGSRYIARIKRDGQEHYLGSYGSDEEASQAYKAARRRLYPELP